MNFESALTFLKQGGLVSRAGWNGKGLRVQIQPQSDPYQRAYLYILDVEGMVVPWVPSQTDLLAEDWEMLGILQK